VKTALLGGSFNPVHNGHLALAADVLKLGYQRIIFIPAARSPLKKSLGGASDKDRIAMLELALKDFDGADIWDGEIRRGGHPTVSILSESSSVQELLTGDQG